MKILFVTIGRKNNPGLESEISDFTERISHYAPVEWKIIPPSTIEEEGNLIKKVVTDRDCVVLLDEKGKELDSNGLAKFIEKRLNASTHRLVFIIGGAYGVSQDIRELSQEILAFSKLTFPHQLMRLILAEQIYRAFSILKGERYHHS